MKKILNDMRLLHEQGYAFHLWLECTTTMYSEHDSEIQYFDGYALVDTSPAEPLEYVNKISKAKPLFIQPVDIEDFTIDTLYLLRGLNSRYYARSKPITYPETNEGEIDESEEKTTLIDYFFKYQANRALKYKHNFGYKVVLSRNSLKAYFSPYDPFTVTMEEAMQAFFEGLSGLKRETTYHEESRKGLYYRKLGSIRDKTAFTPDLFNEFINGDLEIKDSKGSARVGMGSVYLDKYEEFFILKAYAATIEGLDEYLENFEVETTAKVLAGKKVREIIHGVEIENRPFSYEETKQGATNVIYRVPDLGFLVLKYKNPIIGIVPYDYTSALLGGLEVCPLYINSVSFENNELDIRVMCSVRQGFSFFPKVELPFCFAFSGLGQQSGVYLDFKCKGCSLLMPRQLFRYIKTDYDLDSIIGEEILNSIVKPRQYESVYTWLDKEYVGGEG